MRQNLNLKKSCWKKKRHVFFTTGFFQIQILPHHCMVILSRVSLSPGPHFFSACTEFRHVFRCPAAFLRNNHFCRSPFFFRPDSRHGTLFAFGAKHLSPPLRQIGREHNHISMICGDEHRKHLPFFKRMSKYSRLYRQYS